MGVLNKLKNIFYDEVEVDEDDNDEEELDLSSKFNRFHKKEEKKVEEKPKIEEIKFESVPEEEEEEVIDLPEEKKDSTFSERDLFRSERTFNFVDFTDDEEEQELPKRNVLNDVNRNVRTELPETEKRVFKPSPTISPVWGILDKDYKKDEIKSKPVNKSDSITSSVTTYDSVRRKAYGTLEDELEDTLNSMDNKLSTETINKEISSVDKDMDLLEQKTSKIEDLISKIEEETSTLDKNMSIEEAEEKVELENFDEEEPVKEEKKELDNTLEHDLFNLIDSMYDEEE